MARTDPGNISSSRGLITLAATAIVIAALYVAQDVLVPLALAVLISFLLTPLVLRLQRIGLGRIPSVVSVMVLALALVAMIGWLVTGQFLQLAQELPQYRDNIHHRIESLRSAGGGPLSRAIAGIKGLGEEFSTTQPAASAPATQPAATPQSPVLPTPAPTPSAPAPTPLSPLGAPASAPNAGRQVTPASPVQVQVVEPAPSPLKLARETLSPLLDPLATAGIVIVFVLFILLQREDLRDRVIRLIGQGQVKLTTQVMDDAAGRVSRYLLMQSIVNGTFGLGIGIGLFFIGIPSFAVWGLLAATLRFIPYLGPWLAASMPIAVSLAIFNDWWHPAATLGLFVVLELISNNAMEPWLYGSSTGVSPIAILVAAAFWTWLWGAVGLLLSTPLTVCLAVMGKYVPQLGFLGILLGDEPVLSPAVRYYQRLLAGDSEEAAEVVEEFLEDHPLEAMYDEVILPALALAGQDRRRGQLELHRERFLLESARELVEELGEERGLGEGLQADVEQEEPISSEPARRLEVLCLPARDEADELGAVMLSQLLCLAGHSARYVSVKSLAGEMIEAAGRLEPSLICLSALPPDAITHTRYLCKRLTSAMPSLPLLVGIWSDRLDIDRIRPRIRCRTDDPVVMSLRAAVAQVTQLAHSLLLKQADVAPQVPVPGAD